jgi:LPXTG-motif cell wall-anchored protein
MVVNATAVTESPETVVAHEVKLTGTPPPPPPEPIQTGATLLIIVMRPVAAPVETAAAEPAPQTLPKTGSSFPLIGLLGAAFCSLALGLKIKRALSA